MYDINIKTLEQLIKLQKSSLKLYVYYTVAIIVIGLFTIICGQLFFAENSPIKTIISSGGTIITSFSGLSFKEFLTKKESINLYNTFKTNIEIYKDNEEKQRQFEITLQNYLFKN